MPVGEICTREVVIVKRKDSILEAASLMRRFHVGDVVVVEDKGGQAVPVGILTDRDIVVEIVAKSVPLDSVFVEDIMSSDLQVVQEERGIWDSLQCMRARGVRRIVVVNVTGGLVGIVSADDLLELLAGELVDLAKIMAREQEREKVSRE